MAGRRDIRVVGGLLALTMPLLILAGVAAGGIALWERGDLNRFICDGDCGPAWVVAPSELTSSAQPQVEGASSAVPGKVDGAKVAAAVAPALKDADLGPHVGFVAVSPGNGKVLTSSGTGTFAPASTTKVLTGFAALSTLNPNARYSTSTVLDGAKVVLVGGGDPYLTVKPAKPGDDRVFRADLTTLAKRTAAALKKVGVTKISLGYDASLFSGPDFSPTWQPSYLSENVVTPVSALWADQGMSGGVRSAEPAALAARTFATLLGDQGISVAGAPAAAKAPAGGEALASMRSATVSQIVETLIRVSDNQAAEVMLRHLAIGGGEPATFTGGDAVVRAALTKAGVDVTGLRLNDGSGLSRQNRISPTTLVQTLVAAQKSPQTSGLSADLPVSGFTGTLVERFVGLPDAKGMVRAKTGTLRGIHSLAGYSLDADGNPVMFVVMADRADADHPLEARAALDRAAAAIAQCHCSGR